MGFFWISVNVTPRKRGRAGKDSLTERWNPRAGDLIVSNWVSYFELLWLAFRFNPTFILPVAKSPARLMDGPIKSPTQVTGRHTGTGSANVQSPTTTSTSHSQSPIVGFREVSLLKMLSVSGCIPPFGINTSSSVIRPLEEIRKSSKGPIVVFPECTTSNGRGLLRFAQIFGEGPLSIPVRNYSIFVMCVRYDAPTAFSPTLTLSLPHSPTPDVRNVVRHLFSMTLTPSQHISIRLLPPSESPSAATFVVSDVVSTNYNSAQDMLREACETLVAGLGKLKRTQLGWEEKSGIMEMYYGKVRR